MAERPVFIPFTEGSRLVKEVSVDFAWNPGLAPIQKKKNISALHSAASRLGISPLLEVSTKSELDLGLKLSAFNLQVELDEGQRIPLECAFQGSKTFENGGPYTDIFWGTSREARKDYRLRESGPLRSFKFEGIEFPLVPKTAFYDWLYCRALRPLSYADELRQFAGFTDIEFNPEKSINCQARSCALFVALEKRGLLQTALKSPSSFIDAISADSLSQPHSADLNQGKLFD